jgi:hypothetical protein
LVPEIVALLWHEIDHIVALKHGRQTTAENLALSCTLCNKHKGSDIAAIDSDTGEMQPLFHPRRIAGVITLRCVAARSFRTPLSAAPPYGYCG